MTWPVSVAEFLCAPSIASPLVRYPLDPSFWPDTEFPPAFWIFRRLFFLSQFHSTFEKRLELVYLVEVLTIAPKSAIITESSPSMFESKIPLQQLAAAKRHQGEKLWLDSCVSRHLDQQEPCPAWWSVRFWGCMTLPSKLGSNWRYSAALKKKWCVILLVKVCWNQFSWSYPCLLGALPTVSLVYLYKSTMTLDNINHIYI